MKHIAFIFSIVTIFGFSNQLLAQLTSSPQFKQQILFEKTNEQTYICYRIPSLITAKNGDLIAAIDQRFNTCGDLNKNDNINIVIRRSTNNGKSWLAPETIVDYPQGESASDPSMVVDEKTGEIFMFFNYMNLKNEMNVYYFKFVKSNDNGKTWSQPVDITSQLSKPEWKNDFKFITSGRATQTKSGTILHTIVNLKRGLFVFGSHDNGKTWFLNETPIKPADESIILELNNGDWMINSRVQKAGCRYVHISNDQGKTWSTKPDSSLIDPACNAGFIRYKSKKNKYDFLIFSNLNSKTNRESLTLRFSKDEGVSWFAEIPIYKHSSAYSSITVLKNGNIGVLFEQDDYSKISFMELPIKIIRKSLYL